MLAAYPGATAEQVEDQVTRKIEQRLFGYEEVRKGKTVSTSMAGGASRPLIAEGSQPVTSKRATMVSLMRSTVPDSGSILGKFLDGSVPALVHPVRLVQKSW